MGHDPASFWSRSRRLFRWCRILVLICITAVMSVFLYLNRVGVPRFVTEQVETELRARGLDVRLGRVRLRGFHELAARNIHLAPGGATNGASLLIGELGLRLDTAALKRWQFKLDSIALLGTQLLWQPAATNGTAPPFSVDDIATELRFLDGDRWELRRFDGRLLGTQLHLTASVTNASALRALGGRPTAGQPAIDWAARIDPWVEKLQRIQLSRAATLEIRLAGDARIPSTWTATLQAGATTATTPWGGLERLNLAAAFGPSAQDGTNAETRVDLRIGKLEAADHSAFLENLSLQGRLRFSPTNRSLLSANLSAGAGRVAARWGQATNLHLELATKPAATGTERQLETSLTLDTEGIGAQRIHGSGTSATARFSHSLTNFGNIEGQWRIDINELAGDWGGAGNVRFNGHVASPDFMSPVPAAADWGPWSPISPLALDWECELGRVTSPQLQLESLHTAGSWRAPHLRLARLHASLYGGQFDASASLDVASRETAAQAAFDFDVRRIGTFLTPAARRWLDQFSWNTPPKVRAEAHGILPAWSNPRPDWRAEVLPTVAISGEFAGTGGAFRGVSANAARSHFTFTNFTWNLPDLVVTRPEGESKLGYSGDMRTQDYEWNLDTRLDPAALTPLLDESVARALALFQFPTPPRIRGRILGRWMDRERTGFSADLAATNFTFRGERCDQFAASVHYTNLFLNFTRVRIARDGHFIEVPEGSCDFREEVILVTNAVSTMDATLATRVMGPKIEEVMRPYHFKKPPTVHASGRIPIRDTDKADLHFEITGTEFSYWKFNIPEISGVVNWRGDSLSVTNVRANFYNGSLDWSGEFDFSPPVGTDFRFRGTVKESDARRLMADLHPGMTNLQGTLDGQLSVTSANSDDWKSWQGYGEVRLRNGFLWNIPIFGFLSPILNKVVPGIGQTPASSGSATYTIDNSVIQTRDLEVRSRALRMQYEGTVDFDGRVDARMQAEVLRDAWGVGRVVSLALWPLAKVFEFKISGTLAAPKSEPLYIPRLLFFPFHPVKTLRDIFTENEPATPPKPAPREQ
jgi:hypothetical protein